MIFFFTLLRECDINQEAVETGAKAVDNLWVEEKQLSIILTLLP